MREEHGAERLVEVAVLVAVDGTFTYRVPPALAGVPLRRGQRVLVPFGRRRLTGVVLDEDAPAPEGHEVRDLLEILDLEPLLPEPLLSLSCFASDYYLHPLGDVLRTALPPGLALKGARFLVRDDLGARGEQAAQAPASLRDPVAAVLEALAEAPAGRLRIGGRSGIAPHLAVQVAATGAAHIEEAWEGVRGSPVRARWYRLARTLDDAEEALRRAPAQRAVVRWLARRGVASHQEITTAIPRAAPLLRRLIERDLVEESPHPPVEPTWSPTADPARPKRLSPEQAPVVEAMVQRLGAFSAHLVEGVTGSGKTEIYLRLIEEALLRGWGALVLVPEIALTPLLVGRFEARFGDTIALLHSGLTAGERRESWHRLRRGDARIAIGVRSAIFAPVERLGVVIVDEEHDGSFKQEDGLRYHARDLAVIRARQAEALLVLGSATPSMESLHNAAQGRYEHHRLRHRVCARPLPKVEIIDLRSQRPLPHEGGAAAAPLLTAPLLRALEEVLDRGQQAILFLNRRGQAPALLCVACGETQRCPNCEVSLTLHREPPLLLCHYCGFEDAVPRTCGRCGGELQTAGAGTQALEAEVHARLAGVRVLRLDRDTTRRRGAMAEALAAFGEGAYDVMVGTQMVAKGHDFPGVTLVGVVLADQGLWLPDLRAAERTAQLLFQVAGRAGRGGDPGRVLLQTYRPDHPAIATAVARDYEAFSRVEIEERAAGRWPPFSRLLLLRLSSNSARRAEEAALRLARAAERAAIGYPEAGLEILGPAPAPLARLRGRTRWQLLIKADTSAALRWIGGYLATLRLPGSVRLGLDVDPISML